MRSDKYLQKIEFEPEMEIPIYIAERWNAHSQYRDAKAGI